jgi:hypothetical protein
VIFSPFSSMSVYYEYPRSIVGFLGSGHLLHAHPKEVGVGGENVK